MAPLTITSSATAEILAGPALPESIPELRQQRERLSFAIDKLRVRLTAVAQAEERVLELDRQTRTVERAANPEDLRDLLAPFLYEDDGSFEPTPVDEERRLNYQTREAALSQSENDARRYQSQIQGVTSLLDNGPKRVEQMEQKIGDINGGRWARLKNYFTQERETLITEIDALRRQILASPTQLVNAESGLVKAKLTLAQTKPTAAYDVSIHDVKEATLLSRHEQAVLVTFQGGKKSSVTLRLPTSPDDQDFTQSITFVFDSSDDQREFGELLGEDIRLYGAMGDTVRDNLEYDWDFENELIPFPLEVADFKGQKKIRIPQAAFERFQSNVY